MPSRLIEKEKENVNHIDGGRKEKEKEEEGKKKLRSPRVGVTIVKRGAGDSKLIEL